MLIIIFPFLVYAQTITERDLNSEQCQPNCLSCKNGKYECLQCQARSFLYTLPNDDDRMQLKAGARICVQCPQSEFFGELIQSCSNCQINAEQWELSRECEYEYKKYDQAQTYVKIVREKKVYHISQADANQGSDYYIVIFFFHQANICEGCRALCSSASLICFPATESQQAGDPQKKYFQCQDGYYYDEFERQCQQCPQNCATCQATPQIQTKSNIIKCNTCQDGFTIYVNAGEFLAEPIQECIQCPLNCLKCYFGNLDHDFSKDNWSSFKVASYVYVDGSYEEAMSVYQSLYDIDLRCTYCLESSRGSFIPSLDLRVCVGCENKCDLCEYITWDQTIVDTGNQKLIYPTFYGQIITEPSTYSMICTRCQNHNGVRTLKGNNCIQCPLNSLVCYQYQKSNPSIKSNIPGIKPIEIDEIDLDVKTVMCMDNYVLNSFGSCVEKSVTSIKNCKTQSSDTQCQLCEDNFILQPDCINLVYLVTCVIGCKAQVSSCRSCIVISGKIECQDCEDGFFLNVLTKTCEACTTISNDSCLSCYQYSNSCVIRPYYPDDPCRPTIHQQEDIRKLICFECSVGVSLIQQKCLTCGIGCKVCETAALVPRCQACIDSTLTSTTSNGDDCLICPKYCEGCQDNSINLYEKICYKCQDSYYMDTTLNRCLSCSGSTYCKKRVVINFNVYCGYKQRQQDELILENYQSDDTQNKAYIDLLKYRESEIEQYNQEVVSELEFNLIFMGDSPCIFKKDTHFLINANIPSLQKLEINIRAENVVSFYVYSYIILHGFNKVSLKNIRYLSFSDYKLNLTPSPKAFGLVLMDNKQTEVFLENFEAENLIGKDYYESTSYTKPNSDEAIIKKKYTQFVMDFNNVYSLSLKNVQFKSMNYLNDPDQSPQRVLLKMNLDPQIIVPYFQLTIDSLLLEDVSFEDQTLFEIQNYQMTSNLYENTKMEINNLQFINCYFGQNSGVFTQNTIQVAGQLFINNIRLYKVAFNQSHGLINMNTLMQASITQLQIEDVIAQNSTVIKMNTVLMNSFSVKKSQFLEQGFLFKSQLEAPWFKQIGDITYGLQMSFTAISIVENICQEPNCLFEIFSPANKQQLKIDLKITKINIELTDTKTFLNKTKLNEADSSLVSIVNLNSVQLLNFDSINNPNIPIMNIKQSGSTEVQNVKCAGEFQDRTNYCLFICEMLYPAIVFVRNMTFLNLVGIDNSFLAILSYSPQMVLNLQESITISEINATKCTIMQKSQIESSIILIISKQKQQISISNVDFISNTQYTDTALFNSNPTLITMTPYANITLTNSQWMDNSGGGSVAILETNSLMISYITMSDSNLRNPDPKMQGGALNLQGSTIQIQFCNFTNSIAEEGGLMYIKMHSPGNLLLTNLMIKNVHAAHQGSQFLNGGTFYIVGLGQLNAQILDSVIENSNTRNSGGFMYMEPADFQLIVYISNLILYSAQALQGSFIRILNKETNEPQMLTIINVKIIQSYSDHLEFLTLIGKLSREEQQLWMNGNAIIQINSGSIYIDQFNYQNGTAEGFIKADGLTAIYLSKIQIYNTLLFQSPMINFAQNYYQNTGNFIGSTIALVDIYFEGLRTTTQKESHEYEIYETILIEIAIPSRVGLILIENLGTNCQAKIKGLTIVNINCPQCQNGLATFTNVQQDSENSPIIWIKQFNCKYSNTGRLGCFVATIYDLTATSNMNPKTVQQRILFEYTKKDIIQMMIMELYKLECEYGCGINIVQIQTYINSIQCYDNLAKDGGCIYYYGNTGNVVQQTITVDNPTMTDNTITEGVGDIKVVGTALNDVSQITGNSYLSISVDQGPRYLIILVNNVQQEIEYISMQQNIFKGEIGCYLGIPFTSFNSTDLKIYFQGEKFEYYKSQSGTIKLEMDEESKNNCDLEESEIQYDTKLGGFDLNQIKILCSKYVLYANIIVSTNDIVIPTYNETSPYRLISIMKNYTLVIPIKIYRCQDGYGFADRACYYCKHGTYILNSYNEDEKQLDCKNMSTGMKETEGSYIKTLEGFQRLYGDLIEKCDPLHIFQNCDQKDDCHRCKQSDIEGNGACYKGYVGPRCSDCDYSGKVYGEKYCLKDNICQLCSNISPDTKSIQGIFVLQTIVIIALVLLQYWRTTKFASIFLIRPPPANQQDNQFQAQDNEQQPILVQEQPQIQPVHQLFEYPSTFSVVSLIVFEIQMLSIIKLGNFGLQDDFVLDIFGMPAMYYKYIKQKTIDHEPNQELLQEQIYGLQQIYGIQLVCILAFFIILNIVKYCFLKVYFQYKKYFPNIKLLVLGNILYWIILINGPSYFYFILLSNLSYKAFNQQYSLLFPSLINFGLDINQLLYFIILGFIFIFLLIFIVYRIAFRNYYMIIIFKDNVANLVYKSDWRVLIPKYLYPFVLVLIIALIKQNLKSEIERTQSIVKIQYLFSLSFSQSWQDYIQFIQYTL